MKITKYVTLICCLLFLSGSNQWNHGPVQWVWVVSIWISDVLFEHFTSRVSYKEIWTFYFMAATWTTVRRLRSPRTTSIRGQRASDPSALSCCGFWGKVVMGRYETHWENTLSSMQTHYIYVFAFERIDQPACFPTICLNMILFSPGNPKS